MKKKTFYVLVVALILISIGATMMFFNMYKIIDRKVIGVDFTVTKGKDVGFVLDADALHFGRVPKGGKATRKITIRNQGDFDMIVTAGSNSDFAEWLIIPPDSQKFYLSPNETKKLEVSLYVPDDAELGQYNGTMVVLFKRA